MTKVHCAKCGLYLGLTNEEDFPIQITCALCEETTARIRYLLFPSFEFPDTHYSEAGGWEREIDARSREDQDAWVLINLIISQREEIYFRFG